MTWNMELVAWNTVTHMTTYPCAITHQQGKFISSLQATHATCKYWAILPSSCIRQFCGLIIGIFSQLTMNLICNFGCFVILLCSAEGISAANQTSSISYVGPKEQALLDTADIIRWGVDVIAKVTTVLYHLIYQSVQVSTRVNCYVATFKFVKSLCKRSDYLRHELHCCLPDRPEVSKMNTAVCDERLKSTETIKCSLPLSQWNVYCQVKFWFPKPRKGQVRPTQTKPWTAWYRGCTFTGDEQDFSDYPRYRLPYTPLRRRPPYYSDDCFNCTVKRG